MSYGGGYDGGRYGGPNPYDQRDEPSYGSGGGYGRQNSYGQNGYGGQGGQGGYSNQGGFGARPAPAREYTGGSNVEMQSLPSGPRPGGRPNNAGNPYDQRGGGGGPVGGGAPSSGGPTMSPTEILNNCRNIDGTLDELSSRLDSLRSQQRTFLTAPNPNAATVDNMSTQIMDSYRGLSSRVKKVKSQPQSGNSMCAAQVGKVDRRLKSAIQEFQRTDSDFRGQVRDQQARQYKIVRPDADDSEVREAVEDGGGMVFQQALLNSNRRGQAQSALSSVRQRHDAIQKIEQDMMQLAEMFQDLDNIVMEQEPLVENIETKAEETVENVDKGVVELDGGVAKARSARKKKWWCLGLSILIVLVAVIVIVIVLKVLGVIGNTSNNAAPKPSS